LLAPQVEYSFFPSSCWKRGEKSSSSLLLKKKIREIPLVNCSIAQRTISRAKSIQPKKGIHPFFNQSLCFSRAGE